MITIGIDESGNFEQKKYLKKFIGGFIYTGDYEEEKNNLEDFFKNQCKLYKLHYPSGIHSTEMNRRENYRSIKEDIKNNLINYIKHKNEKEQGKYYFICMLKSNKHREDHNNLSNIISDDNASNLYEHMVSQLITNALFHCINFSHSKKINLELAKRVIPVREEERIAEYKKLGYFYKEKEYGTMFYLTDQRSFKSAISTKMMDTDIQNPIDFKLNVKSINYNNTKEETTPYLYLADFVCDIIKEFFNGKKENYDIENCSQIIKNETGRNFFAWVYDDIDGIYNKLVQSFYKKDLMCCFTYIYDAINSSSEYRDYYKKVWIKSIEAKLLKIFDINKMDIYIEQIEYLLSKEISDYEKAMYFINGISGLLVKYQKESEEKPKNFNLYRYKLYDMFIRVYNHRGDIENAKKYYELCEKYKDEVDIERYMATLNRVVEIDANSFNFQEAIDKLQNSVMALDLWKETKEEVAELMGIKKQRSTCLILRGKSLSSLGQFYAFLGDKEKALEYFLEALEEFENSEVQKEVTTAYIMHLALQFNDLRLYQKYEKEYFGDENINVQFEYLMKMGNERSSKDYKFYVYIKALNIFYSDKIDYKLLEEIQKTDYKIKNFKTKSHPWELIYKHIGEIQYKKCNINEANNLIEKAITTVEKADSTIKLINISTKIKYALLKCSPSTLLSLLKEFNRMDFNIEMEKIFKDIIENIDIISKSENLKEKEIISLAEKIVNFFTYMYC